MRYLLFKKKKIRISTDFNEVYFLQTKAMCLITDFLYQVENSDVKYWYFRVFRVLGIS